MRIDMHSLGDRNAASPRARRRLCHVRPPTLEDQDRGRGRRAVGRGIWWGRGGGWAGRCTAWSVQPRGAAALYCSDGTTRTTTRTHTMIVCLGVVSLLLRGLFCPARPDDDDHG